MITIDSTNSTALPSSIGTMLSRLWIMLRSEIERLTICPVCSWSWRAPSSRVSEPNSSVRMVVLDVERHPAAEVAPQVHAAEGEQRPR